MKTSMQEVCEALRIDQDTLMTAPPEALRELHNLHVLGLQRRQELVRRLDRTMGLLPCPFCGGEEPSVSMAGDGRDGDETSIVTCAECGVSMYGSTEEDAVEMWNRRTS